MNDLLVIEGTVYEEISTFLDNLNNKLKKVLLKELSLKGCNHTFHFDCLIGHCTT